MAQGQTQFDSVAMPPRLPLVVTTSNRNESVTKDARLVNCYIEVTGENELHIYKRPGLSLADDVAPGLAGRGVYFWKGHVYSIFGDKLYKSGTEVGSGLDTTNGVYQFDSNLGATPKLIFGNGKEAYTYATSLSATLHSINAEYPEETVKGFAYLNGATYVMQKEAVIWGSALNSVDQAGDWPADNYIRAQIEPDDGVFMAKQLVYVVALKQWSTEYFFDAGNPNGSPLGSVQGMKVHYGCASADSVQKIDDVLCFLSVNKTASLQVSMLDQGAFKVVSTPSIDRLLNPVDIENQTVYSWQLKMNGHSFYVITFKEHNLTLAYDITQDLWFQWTDSNGNYFPIVASTYDDENKHILQHESNGRLYYMDSTTYKDLSDPIIVDIITPIFDGGTYRRKQLNTMKIVGDQQLGSILMVRRSDDDYQTWSPWRNIDLQAKTPMMVNCGTFKKRAYHFRHMQNLPFRISAVELQYDVGTL